VKLFLVRHAKAERRARRTGRCELRRLTAAGTRQAEGLVERLADAGVARMLSSPAHRCRDTLTPLARSLGTPVELDCRLAEGAHANAALNLVRSLGDAPAAVCTHRRVIVRVLEHLLGEAALEDARVDKGSAWLVEGDPAGRLRASYFEPLELPAALGDDVAGSARPLRVNGRRSRVAVLDMGSTSFHLLVSQVTPDGSLTRVARERVMLRLGAELGADSRIPSAVCDRAVDAARELRRHAEDAKVERLIPVATAALREAENGRDVADRLGSALGLPVWILDGEQEARVIFAALRHRLRLREERTLGIDLGGGSLELAVGDGTDVFWETTLRLGVARLHGELVRRDPMKRRERRAIRERVRELLAPHTARVGELAPARCVAVGGTARALLRLWSASRPRPARARSKTAISRGDLAELTRVLLSSSHDERLEMAGMDSRRADLLPTGAAVLSTLLEELGYRELTVCDWGLREGVILLDALGR
jgi:exopolyphosphatase/guanosine-5'-triphosphate,3'-diphosphate pyrophosphatase